MLAAVLALVVIIILSIIILIAVWRKVTPEPPSHLTFVLYFFLLSVLIYFLDAVEVSLTLLLLTLLLLMLFLLMTLLMLLTLLLMTLCLMTLLLLSSAFPEAAVRDPMEGDRVGEHRWP